MFCSKCGSKNEDDAAFCGACGAKLNATRKMDNALSQSISSNQLTNSLHQVQVDTSDSNVPIGQNAADCKEQVNSKTKAIAVGVSIIILLLVAVYLIIMLLTASPSYESEIQQETVVQNSDGNNFLAPQMPDIEIRNSVNDYSWEELSNISFEISETSNESGAIEIAKKYNLCNQDGKLDGTQTKSVALSDGMSVDVQIVGFNHDSKTNGGKAGITFIFKDAIARHDMNPNYTNSGGWENSELRRWLASDGMNMLPDDLKNSLIEVEKLTNNIGETTSTSSVTSTNDKLWLFSATELCGKINWFSSETNSAYDDVLNSEGAEYKLYRDMDVSNVLIDGSNKILIKQFDGASYYWWGRSPNPNNSMYFVCVGLNGSLGVIISTYSDGVVPGFCI